MFGVSLSALLGYPAPQHLQLPQDCVAPEVSSAKGHRSCLTPSLSGGDTAQFVHGSLLVRAVGL